jgi:hypothetical protein
VEFDKDLYGIYDAASIATSRSSGLSFYSLHYNFTSAYHTKQHVQHQRSSELVPSKRLQHFGMFTALRPDSFALADNTIFSIGVMTTFESQPVVIGNSWRAIAVRSLHLAVVPSLQEGR